MSTTICQDGKQFDTITAVACSSPDFDCSAGGGGSSSGDNGSSQQPPEIPTDEPEG